MQPDGKIIAQKIGEDMLFTDSSGESYIIPGYGIETGMPNSLDPRIDLTMPIYEQVMSLYAKDEAKKQKREATAA